MATGIERCMYCEDSHGTDIEHFRPKSEYPTFAFTWENYLLACSECNSNHKRTEFPLDDEGRPLLIDPCVDEPREHLAFSPSTGKFVELDLKGKHSTVVFGLNRYSLERARRRTWVEVQELLACYAAHVQAGRSRRAEEVKATICDLPHQSVLVEIVELAARNDAARYLEAECRDAIANHPEIRQWLA